MEARPTETPIPAARRPLTVRFSRRWGSWSTPSVQTSTQRVTALSTAVVLGGVGALHALWATGSPWPLQDQDRFDEVIMGGDGFPPAAASLAVAGALAGAAVSIAHPSTRPRRLFAIATAVALGARGGVGLALHTLAKRKAPDFARMDLRFYSPLCLTLAACVAASLRPSARDSRNAQAAPSGCSVTS